MLSLVPPTSALPPQPPRERGRHSARLRLQEWSSSPRTAAGQASSCGIRPALWAKAYAPTSIAPEALLSCACAHASPEHLDCRKAEGASGRARLQSSREAGSLARPHRELGKPRPSGRGEERYARCDRTYSATTVEQRSPLRLFRTSGLSIVGSRRSVLMLRQCNYSRDRCSLH